MTEQEQAAKQAAARAAALAKWKQKAMQEPKSQGTAVVLSLLFGPFGMCYASVLWGIIFLIFHIIALPFTLGVGNVIIWFVGVFVSLEIVREGNKKITRARWNLTEHRNRVQPVQNLEGE